MKTAILAATRQGRLVADRIHQGLEGSEIVHYGEGIRRALEQVWQNYDGVVCVMAAGIVVRCISGLSKSKYLDPCVVVVDDAGNHAISLLSGHIGGGNSLAIKVADICGGAAVITTASDVSGHTAVDLWSIEENLSVVNPEKLAQTSAVLLDRGEVHVYQDEPYIKKIPIDFKRCTNRKDADIVIALSHQGNDRTLKLIPRIRFIGFGCKRGTTVDEFREVLADLQDQNDLDLRSVGGIASIDIKKDEEGLLEIRDLNNWPIRFFSKKLISSVSVPSKSETVHRKIGVYGVCEAAAMLAASDRQGSGRLIIKKRKWQRITAAVVEITY